MKYIYTTLIILFIVQFSYSQKNLVSNPSFEIYTGCPNANDFNQNKIPSWNSPTNNRAASYGNSCITNTCCGVPLNLFGLSFQFARTGNAYAAMEFITGYGQNQRDYIQSKLLDSLHKGHCYYIEFFVSRVNISKYAVNNIGLLINNTALQSTNGVPIPVSPQIISYGNPIIKDTVNWIRIGGIYLSKGGEQFITLGNFSDDFHTDTLYYSGNSQAGDYYVDDVSVISLDSMVLKADAGRDTVIKKGDSVWIGSRLCGLQNVVWYDAGGNVIDTGKPGMWVKPMASTYYVIEQNVCGQYSRDTVNVGVSALPVVLKSFKVEVFKSFNVNTSWETASEVNVSHFNVQRSVDGKVFETVGIVKAKGAGKYSFIAPPPPEGGIGYYRLEIVDNNGALSYSEVKEIQIRNEELRITPNPAKDFIIIDHVQLIIDHVIIRDMTGRILIKTKEKKIDIGGLVSGTYIVTVELLNGNRVTEKLVKL